MPRNRVRIGIARDPSRRPVGGHAPILADVPTADDRCLRDLRPRRLASRRGLRPHRRDLPPGAVDGRGPGTVRVAFDRPEVRNAFRPHTVDELYRALDHARMTPDVGCVLLTGNGPCPRTAAGRSARAATSASAAAAATSTPRARPRTPSTPRGPRRGRPAAHPRGAAADPDHAEGRRRGRPRLGGRRRPLAARRVRPDDREPRARALQADRRRRRLVRRRLRLGVPRADGRPEVRPRDLLPRPRVRRRARCSGWAR